VKTLFRAFAAVLLTALCCLGCPKKSLERPKVVVSLYPIYDFARRIGGPDADVVLVRSHNELSRDPSAEEIETVKSVRLAVMVGLGIDGWMEGILKAQSPKARVLKVGDRVPTLFRSPAGGSVVEGKEIDPYVWLDPNRARLIVQAMGEDFARNDAAHASAYRRRAAEIDQALAELDQLMEAKIATWGVRSITPHDACLAYFLDRYHLQSSREASERAGRAVRLEGPVAGLRPFGGGNLAEPYETLMLANLAAIEQAVRP
jgi:zinc transport system substrate-binding protein